MPNNLKMYVESWVVQTPRVVLKFEKMTTPLGRSGGSMSS